MSLDKTRRLDMGLLIFSSSLSKPGFFRSGLSTASFSELCIFPLDCDLFTISVSTGKTQSRLSFKIVVGQGSRYLIVTCCYLTSTSRCDVKQWINNTCQLNIQSDVFVWTTVGTKLPHLCLLVLFNKLQLMFTKLLFGSHKHASLNIIILDSHVLFTTGTFGWLAII